MVMVRVMDRVRVRVIIVCGFTLVCVQLCYKLPPTHVDSGTIFFASLTTSRYDMSLYYFGRVEARIIGR